MVYSINGCRCQVSFDRETEILLGADIYFCEKYGTETFDSLTYYGNGGQAVFDILKDACSVEDMESPDENTDVEDCTEDAGNNTEDTVFYGGTQLTDSLYLNMRACFKEHAAVSLICYLYPVDEGEQVSAEAAAFLDKYMERISSFLEFVFSE